VRPLGVSYLVFALMAALCLGIVLTITDLIAPMPTLIAATRSTGGTALMLAGASMGALSFAWMQGGRRPKGAP
jgi:NAD/NADP transhydrogenase beta subunit